MAEPIPTVVTAPNKWIPDCFHVTHECESSITGWVSSEGELKTVLEAHRRTCLCSFVSWSDDIKRKERTARRLVWRYDDIDADNAPFTIDNNVILCCQYGNPHKRDCIAEKQEDHQYLRRKRFLIQPSRKVKCSAKLFIRRVTRYDAYRTDTSGRKRRQRVLKTLSADLEEHAVESVKYIYVKLPLVAAHTNHNVTVESAFAQRLHPDLKSKIYEYCKLGVTSVPFLRRVLKQFVVSDMCKTDEIQPLPHDRTYFPTRRDIQNHVHNALVAGQFSGLDQDNLEKKINEWRASSNDKFFIRKCTEPTDTSSKGTSSTKKATTAFPDDEQDLSEDEEDEVASNSSFLFVHQSEDQRKLLNKYGDMVLLDATYKTTKYALPLFMVVVRTNVSYVPVMEFICENESTPCITEALALLKSWNPNWSPKFFMLDYSEQEYQALHAIFPDAEKYLCCFHMEQAWNRWTKEIVCPNCSRRYINIESFASLSLPVKNTITVNQALSSFFAPIQHKGYVCRSCCKRVTAQGKVCLLTLPKFMVVQLKRFSYNGAVILKDHRQLEIEEEVRLRVYVKPGEVLEDKFRLIGVVVHDGTPKTGHYRCFTQHGMQWFEINDMIIRRVPFASVKTAQAYILFYRALPRPYIN